MRISWSVTLGMYSLSRCLASSLDISEALIVSVVLTVEDLGHVDSNLVRGDRRMY